MRKWPLVLAMLSAVRISAQFQIPDREIHYRPGDWVSYPVTRFVRSIDMDDRTVYAATTGGIARYDFYSREWLPPYTQSDGMAGGRADLVAYDWNTGFLWCATDKAVNIRLPGSEQWRQAAFPAIGIRTVSALGIGTEFVWLADGDRLFKTGHNGDLFLRGTDAEAEQDAVRWKGRAKQPPDELMPQFFMDGGFVFDRSGVVLAPDLRRYALTDTKPDGFHTLWIGTEGLGMGRADLNTMRIERLPFGLYSPDVRSMAWDGDGLWIGGFHDPELEGGITHWDAQTGEWTYYEARLTPGMRSDQVTSIAPDTDCVWFGTPAGLARFDKKTKTWNGLGAHQNLWSDAVNILGLGDSTLWVGTEFGLNRIVLPDGIVEKVHDPLLDHRAVFDLEDDGGSLWIATDRGPVRLRRGRGPAEPLKGYAGMLVSEATAVSVWKNEVWFATDGGIEVLDTETGGWRGFPRAQYGLGGEVQVLLADSAVVWAGTDDGVVKYLKDENRWRVFKAEDGLPDNDVRWIVPDGDYVWFGTPAGLTRFYWNVPYRRD
jgi:hypothetical protein